MDSQFHYQCAIRWISVIHLIQQDIKKKQEKHDYHALRQNSTNVLIKFFSSHRPRLRGIFVVHNKDRFLTDFNSHSHTKVCTARAIQSANDILRFCSYKSYSVQKRYDLMLCPAQQALENYFIFQPGRWICLHKQKFHLSLASGSS